MARKETSTKRRRPSVHSTNRGVSLLNANKVTILNKTLQVTLLRVLPLDLRGKQGLRIPWAPTIIADVRPRSITGQDQGIRGRGWRSSSRAKNWRSIGRRIADELARNCGREAPTTCKRPEATAFSREMRRLFFGRQDNKPIGAVLPPVSPLPPRFPAPLRPLAC